MKMTVQKDKDYTVMSNYHFKDKKIKFKSKRITYHFLKVGIIL